MSKDRSRTSAVRVLHIAYVTKATFTTIHCNILVYLAMVVLVAIVLAMTKTGHGRRTNLAIELLAILYNERIDFQIDCIFCSFRIA